MSDTDLHISQITESDKPLVAAFISEQWGSSFSVSRGNLYDVSSLSGFIYKKKTKIIGLITYHIKNGECEIVTLDSVIPNKGLGTRLLGKVIDHARKEKCNRVWLITTNDNSHALRFYQKRGFEWIGFYKNAIKESRKLKPEIPKIGNDNIPIQHEIEFEYKINY